MRGLRMLVDAKMFQKVEKILTENGKLPRFFDEVHDELKGRMMITRGEISQELGSELPEDAVAFIGSFDFYDSAVGVAFNTRIKKVVSGIWITPQRVDAETPSEEWIVFFLSKLLESIDEKGSYGMPVYSFIGNQHDMTVIPSMH